MKNNIILASLLILATAICGTLAINVTTAKVSAPQVQSIYVDESEKYANQNFTAFVGAQVFVEVESDSELTYYNYDGATTSLVSVSDNVYTVTMTSSEPMQTQIIFQNDGGYSFVNVEFVDTVIDSLSIVSPYMVSNSNISTFSLLINDNSMLKYSGQINFFLSINGAEKIGLSADNEYVESISGDTITLDFSSMSTPTSVTLYASIGQVDCSLDFVVQDCPLSEAFTVGNSSVGYMDGSSQIIVNVSISAGSLADFAVIDDYIRLDNVEFVGQTDGVDTYTLTLDISNASTPSLVIVGAQTTLGQVLRGVNLNKLSTITSFEIVADKEKYAPNEKIVITSVVDGDETFSGDIVWYVNGIEVSQGATLSLQRSEGGSFTVYAMIDEIQSNTLTLNISYQNLELIIWYIVLVLTVLVLIGLIIFKKKKMNYYVTTSLLDRARKIIPRYNTQFNNYNKRQFKKLIYDVAMLRDDTYSNFNDTKDFCFERAGRGLATATNAMREIYKADEKQKKTAFVENTNTIETNINMAIEIFMEYSQAHPNEKILAFNINKHKKKQKAHNNQGNSLFSEINNPTGENIQAEIQNGENCQTADQNSIDNAINNADEQKNVDAQDSVSEHNKIDTSNNTNTQNYVDTNNPNIQNNVNPNTSNT